MFGITAEERIKSALGTVETTIETVALYTSILYLILGILFLVGGIYLFKKYQKKEEGEKSSKMYTISIILIIIGAVFLLYGISGIISYIIGRSLLEGPSIFS